MTKVLLFTCSDFCSTIFYPTQSCTQRTASRGFCNVSHIFLFSSLKPFATVLTAFCRKGTKLRVNNVHYDLTERDLEVFTSPWRSAHFRLLTFFHSRFFRLRFFRVSLIASVRFFRFHLFTIARVVPRVSLSRRTNTEKTRKLLFKNLMVPMPRGKRSAFSWCQMVRRATMNSQYH